MSTNLPVVAIVGRPNVGKSSLVNRIIGRREAIVEETPGVTRDRKGFIAEWEGRRFEAVDTGGLELGAAGLGARVAEQARIAIQIADVVLLVVDAGAGPLQDDISVADLLRRSGARVLVVANKVDDPRDEPSAASFFRLGLGEPIPVSALHGRGSGDLLHAVVEALPEAEEVAAAQWASIAIVGRPNVGKSSLLNALLGESRSIVDPDPGTTRDPVDSVLDLADGRRLRIVDTAGMRRQVRIKDPLEYFSFLRARRILERVDVVILVVDASEGITGHDQRIADAIVQSGRACVVVLNKWDLTPAEDLERERFERRAGHRLRFLEWAVVVRTSAISGRGVRRVLPAVEQAVAAHRRRLPTAAVNRVVANAQDERPPARVRGRPTRILYAVQARVGPPAFVLFCNRRPDASYLRYVERRLREAGDFGGTPISVSVRTKSASKVKT
ncbi:MAG: ribosome biogenesis GTPase Der [Actinomycetota bacterium]